LIRVTIISQAAELGGAERSLLTFLKAAHGRTVAATVLMPREGPLGELLTELGVPWQVVSMPTGLLLQSRQNHHPLGLFAKLLYQGPGYLGRLAGAIRRTNPEVIYSNGIKSNLLSALLGPLLQLGVVWHVRDHWRGALETWLADWGADLIIANSQSSATNLRTRMRRPGKVRVIYNAVDLEEFSPEGPVADLAAFPKCRYKIALVAAFAKIKGQTLFIHAAERIRRAFPSASFFLIGGSIYDTVGDREYEEEVHKTAEAKGVRDCVFFTGFQQNMAPWYRAMDIVVNASIVPESFGRTLLEAMACGKAVVGPNAGGIPEFVQHGKKGLLYEMGNVGTLAEAVLPLLRETAWRQKLGSAGRETAVRRFAPQPQAQAILRILLESSLGVLTRKIC
jgi:glycosyltransferase involved in cell wall biosynthesis